MNLPFSVDLTGKVAVVTGAGGVLMSEFARALAACGARVALLDINAEAAEGGICDACHRRKQHGYAAARIAAKYL